MTQCFSPNIIKNHDNNDIDSSSIIKLPNFLTTKSQLNGIIISNKGSPDYLAINIYYDTLRSWYNHKTIYKKDGSFVLVNKLKTQGVYLSYKKLSQTHACSEETIRRKLVKLEKLGLINRSFKHMNTVTTNSYNQLIIYVWQQTPFFFNKCGIDKTLVSELNPQTNHQYIKEKYNIVFTCKNVINKGNEGRGGIHTQEDTKELNKPFSKEKDRSIKKSNFVKKYLEEKKNKKN